MTVNKQDIIREVSDIVEVPQNRILPIFEQVIDVITGHLADGDKVNIVGFGKFEHLNKLPKHSVNPRTGEPMTIPAMRTLNFKISKLLKQQVNVVK